MSRTLAATLLRRMFDAAVAAASPSRCLPAHLPRPPRGRTVVAGAGKAAAAMAQALEQHWSWPISGMVITRYGHGAPCERIDVVEAAHPTPDAAGEAAARHILDMVQGLTPDDLLLCLISGGGSALLALPAPGLTLADKQAVTRALLRSGANIGEINCVRKHLSAIKGGRLALAAHPARVASLIISDVPGDDPSVIASGPTVADASTREHAMAVLARHRISAPAAVLSWLQRPESETPKPGDAALAAVSNVLIASPMASLRAAESVAKAAGFNTHVVGDDLQGEARDCAAIHAQLARDCQQGRGPVVPPCVLISGGETTVTLRGHGRGGRNAEFLLGLAVSLAGCPGMTALACDTDGIDGTEDNAGACCDATTLARARDLAIDAQAMLDDNNAHEFFAALGDLVVTGPTLTNVNDFRAVVIEEATT
jgi:hydroxypyruvate reductase